MKVLVTGGAGYIGSVTVEALLARGDEVLVVDNLSTGHEGALFPAARFEPVDILDTAKMSALMKKNGTEAVVHFAAFSLVPESVEKPGEYIRNNVGGTVSLLDAMRDAGVPGIVFSSTAAVYGEPKSIPIAEDEATSPTNPYGMTKRFMEQAMEAYEKACGLRHVCLRYFNAAGASQQRGEAHKIETHLIPIILQVALGKRDSIQICGTDYNTPDGTCVRDYIHVEDLASAHLLALDHLARGGPSLKCNLGNGQGYSVRQVIEVCREVTGHKIPSIDAPKRQGDPAKLVASSHLAHDVLGWKSQKGNLKTIVEDAWRWHSTHPTGYQD